MILCCCCEWSSTDTANVISFFLFAVTTFAAIYAYKTFANGVYVSNFKIIYSEIKNLKKEIEEYQYNKMFGLNAIQKFLVTLSNTQQVTYEDTESFKYLVLNFNRIFFLLDRLQTNKEYNEFIIADIKHIYIVYFSKSLSDVNALKHITYNDNNEPLRTNIEEIILSMVNIIERVTDN